MTRCRPQTAVVPRLRSRWSVSLASIAQSKTVLQSVQKMYLQSSSLAKAAMNHWCELCFRRFSFFTRQDTCTRHPDAEPGPGSSSTGSYEH